MRLREHREWRRGLPLGRVPDYTTLYRFRQRLDDQKIDQALGEAARRLGTVGRRRRAPVAVDATGRAPGAVSTFLVRRLDPHRGPGNEGANLPALVETANHGIPLGLVLADAEFDRERNPTSIRQQIGARSILPAKRGKKSWRLHGVRAARRRNFPRHPYARPAWVETLFSTVKRKLSARAPGRSLFRQLRQALLLGLAYNLYRL